MRKKIISLAEIGILILAVFSFSFLISEPKLVSAEQAQCCELTKEGGICQSITNSGDCASTSKLSPSSCSQTSFCKEGCCIDEVQGTYDPHTPQGLCIGTNSKWVDDANCNVPGAKKGCCVLGSETAFVTSQACSHISVSRGLNIDYRQNYNEAMCFALSKATTEGACVLENNCKFSTFQECNSLNGKFSEGFLCTSPELNTSCKKTSETGCVNGKDGVYFLDSCGNRANIYDSSKVNDDNYWNKVVLRDDACNPLSGNVDSKSCGNCDRFLGGICSLAKNVNPDNGNFACKTTDCTFKGKTYKNGESWCVYDGKIGEGDDTVGSRHWKYVCTNGDVQVEPCADYRQQVCVQSELNLTTGDKFTNAACRVNNWRQCLDFNSEPNATQKCSDLPDCYVKEISFAESFNFNYCVPEYPAGFSFSESRGQDNVCGQGTRTCIITYKKETFGGCKEIDNGACDEPIFAEEMNDLCTSLGDCGGYVNVIGEYSDKGYSVSGAGGISQSIIDEYIKRANPANYIGQFTPVGNLTVYLQAAGLLGFNEQSDAGDGNGDDEDGGGSSLAASLPMGIGGIGYALSVASYVGSGEKIGSILLNSLSGANPAGNAYLAGFANAFMAIGIIVGAASLITSLLGYQVSNTGMIAGALAGTAVAYVGDAFVTAYLSSGGLASESALFSNLLYDTFLLGPSVTYMIVGVAVAVAVMILFGDGGLFGGECPPKVVTFTCSQWEPPTDNKCEECNKGGKADKDGLSPCSEYRCKSLGAACNLLNKGTSDEKCVEENPNDITPPKMEPQLNLISNNSIYSDVTNSGFKITDLNGECLEAYTQLNFGITTNEPAECRFDLTQKKFEEMAYHFGTGTYVKNHSVIFPLPSPDGCGLNWTGDLNLYIKCQDTHGNEYPNYYTVGMCVNNGKDITEPIIKGVFPSDNALVAYNATFKQVLFYTPEPTDCKWSLEDKHYNLMENEMKCINDCAMITPFGFLCSAELPVTSVKNKFYIRCADQPLKTEQDKNFMSSSFIYNLEKVSNALTISRVYPEGNLEVNSNPATVELKVETLGGGKTSVCEFSFSGYETMIQFLETGKSIHKQPFNLAPNEYKVYIKCFDETQAVSQKEVIFRITHDTSSPQVTRIFQSENKVTLMTSEKGLCKYSTDSEKECAFNFNSASSLNGDEEHTMTVIKGKRYYIKCEDEFGNRASGCSAIVQAT